MRPTSSYYIRIDVQLVLYVKYLYIFYKDVHPYLNIVDS